MTENSSIDDALLDRDSGRLWPEVFKTTEAKTKEEKLKTIRQYFSYLKGRYDEEIARRIIKEEGLHMLADEDQKGGYLGIKENPETGESIPFYQPQGGRTPEQYIKITRAAGKDMSRGDMIALATIKEILGISTDT